MNYTPYLLILIIFLLLIHLKYQNKLENYTSGATHFLYLYKLKSVVLIEKL